MAAIEWASSTSVPSVAGSSSYDVFLNFRGKDTRNNFTGFLHKALKDRGINVFMDNEQLWTGEAIGPTLLRAIRGSKISIPIFSKGYAHSKWCLMELAQMVQCHKTDGQMILPIFFLVEPAHVRNQTGSFAEALRQHENNFEPYIVEGWRKALRVVGSLRGEVIDETRNQVESVEFVVKWALGEFVSSMNLAECKYPIGIDCHAEYLLPLLNIGSKDVQFMGICGLGGIGKTTIAKAVYNRIRRSFNRHSFLSDVREHAMQFMGIVSLQKRLLKDILKEDIDIYSYDRGKKWIEERLCKENVLLVLDDVDSQEQVDALAGELNWFGQGSRVIITTRDKNILDVAKVDKDKIYWPRELEHKESLQLFSLHAFSMDQPPEGYLQISRDLVCYSGGLPLTLEVLGSYLSDIDSKEVWESTLLKLKEMPHEKVWRRLKISYDNLEDDYQKAIFLDAACFFIGWEKETVISIWKACGYYPNSAIHRLTKRSLLKFEDNEYGGCCLRMHDQIRDMGRGIVLEESLMEPGKRSRLWSHREILEVVEEQKGTGMIKGMILPNALKTVYLASEHFEMMLNLRFLDIGSANFIGDFFYLPSALRWFKWECHTWDILPTNFYHKRLVHLNLSSSMFEKAWNIGPQDENKRFRELKVLDLSECYFLSKSPDFSWFPYLERLDLGNCISLENLDKSIGKLSQLKSLVLSWCPSINELPKSIADLKSLVNLDLSWTQMEELPDSISRLSSLKELILKECTSLKKLPESIGDLKSLVKLDLSWTQIEELPDSISRLSSLKELILKFCDSFKKLPESIVDLTSLVGLHLSNVSGIEELLDGVGLLENLEVLDATDCRKLVKLPRSMGRMRCLHSIHLKGINISELPDDFSMLENLVVLEMSWRLQSLPADLSHLKKLKQLIFFKCHKLEYLPELPSSLVELCCERCYSLVQLPDLSRLKILTTLKLKDCEKLVEIQGLEGTESLVKFKAQGCHNLTHTPKKIHGQGTLLPDRSGGDCYFLTATGEIYDDKGLILCLVLDFPSYIMDNLQLEQGLLLTIDLDISASIHQGDKTTRYLHTLRIEDVEFIHQDIIYLHHFKGFNWFGIPLQGKDAIELLYIRSSDQYHYYRKRLDYRVKFWKLLFVNREADQPKPDQHSSAMMVADFFTWSRVEVEVEGSTFVPKELGEEKEGVLMRASNYKGACLDDEDNIASCVVVTLNDGPNLQTINQPSKVQKNRKSSPYDNPEEEERNDKTVDFLSCLGFNSVLDVVKEEGEMLRPSKRARLHDNGDEAADTTKADDDVGGSPSNSEEAE